MHYHIHRNGQGETPSFSHTLVLLKILNSLSFGDSRVLEFKISGYVDCMTLNINQEVRFVVD